MDKQESLTLQEVESVVSKAVNWWMSAIANKGGETTQEQMQNFQSILSAEVKVNLARTGYVTLQTDNYPEELLAKAARQSFVKGSAFPQRTFMDISPQEVGVRQNRGARKLVFAVQKKTKLASNAGETQKNIDPLSNTQNT